MPIYEYQCPKCGKIEVLQKISESPLSECPRCIEQGENSPVERLVSASAFHLKGSGWYKTDYASSGSSSTESSSSTTKKDTASTPSDNSASSSETKSSETKSSSAPKEKKSGGDSASSGKG